MNKGYFYVLKDGATYVHLAEYAGVNTLIGNVATLEEATRFNTVGDVLQIMQVRGQRHASASLVDHLQIVKVEEVTTIIKLNEVVL